MASAKLSRRAGKVVGYPLLREMSDRKRREFHEALHDADRFEDLPGKWQAAILEAEQRRSKLRVVSGDWGSRRLAESERRRATPRRSDNAPASAAGRVLDAVRRRGGD
jgi:hypothetical protein